MNLLIPTQRKAAFLVSYATHHYVKCCISAQSRLLNLQCLREKSVSFNLLLLLLKCWNITKLALPHQFSSGFSKHLKSEEVETRSVFKVRALDLFSRQTVHIHSVVQKQLLVFQKPIFYTHNICSGTTSKEIFPFLSLVFVDLEIAQQKGGDFMIDIWQSKPQLSFGVLHQLSGLFVFGKVMVWS